MERLDRGAGVLSLSLGSLVAGGDYGTSSNTTIWSSAVGVRLRSGNWRLTASLPWLSVTTRSSFFTGIDGIPVLVARDTAPSRRTAKGFGDITVGAAYTIAPSGSPVEVELSGRAKINTASDRSGLSSGSNDYAVGAEITRPIGRFAPFASVTYRFLGDAAGYRLRDGAAASVGSSLRVGERAVVLTSYHYARAATRLVPDLHELFAGASTQVGGQSLRLTGFVTAGLSSGAAGVSGGGALSLGF